MILWSQPITDTISIKKKRAPDSPCFSSLLFLSLRSALWCWEYRLKFPQEEMGGVEEWWGVPVVLPLASDWLRGWPHMAKGAVVFSWPPAHLLTDMWSLFCLLLCLFLPWLDVSCVLASLLLRAPSLYLHLKFIRSHILSRQA